MHRRLSTADTVMIKFVKTYKENLILLLAHFATDINQGSVSAALTVMLNSGVLHSKQEMSYLVLASTLVSSLIQPIVGYISDRKPRPYLMSLGIIISALGLMFIGFITPPPLATSHVRNVPTPNDGIILPLA